MLFRSSVWQVNPMAWQCSPKFDQALEEMSEWFKDAGPLSSAWAKQFRSRYGVGSNAGMKAASSSS